MSTDSHRLPRANTRALRICAWSGPVFVAAFLIGLLLAGLVPPPSPGLSAHDFADALISDRTRFRIGLLIGLASSGLYAFFCAGLTVQLKRIEGDRSPMSYAQLGLGVLAVLLIIFPLMFLLAAAYRPARGDDTVQLLADIALFPFVGAWMTVVFQWIATAIAIFSDNAQHPVFPRWAGYLSLWCALQSLPSSLLFFVHDGPLAWNGILSYWLALTAFAAWILAMSWLLLQPPRRGNRRPAPTPQTM
jgi:hypothetical protein